jgi:hypothetical protein
VLKDTKYPLCSRYGLLRKTFGPHKSTNVVISTGALYRLVGPEKYKRYLPMMQYRVGAGPTPGSCEAFLRSLNGELR